MVLKHDFFGTPSAGASSSVRWVFDPALAQDEGDNLKAMAAALHKESGTVEDAISRQEDATSVGWQIDID